jgi:hypothetical protein
MSSLQCLKRVHLEVHHRDLAEYSAATEASFAIGHEVGDVAIQVYDNGAGALIPWSGGSFSRPLRLTAELMGGLLREPVFEATLEHEDVLVREDVLLPAGNDSWRVVEIKASTRLKPEHVQDCAIQAWVHRGAGHGLDAIALGHVNNQFQYPGGGDYAGLFIEHDLTEKVDALLSSVPAWVDAARNAVEGDMPEVPVGQHCFKPYECPFIRHCWPRAERYPIVGLRGSRKRLGEFVAAGYRDIRDVPATELNETQLRIRRASRLGEAELLPAGGRFFRELKYPRYYLDFEAAGPPVPVWENTRPYEVLPFQYSCHIEHASDPVGHVEFLDMSGAAPMRSLAEKLIADLGVSGPILMYTTYELRVIQGLADRFPDLATDLRALMDRLVDMKPVVKQNYYHPDQLGSWSIKDVLPTIAPDLDYANIEGIAEGTAAARAYLSAIHAETSPEERQRIKQELLTYCHHDTLAMLRIAEFFADN